MVRLRCLLLAASCLVCLQSADVGRAVRGAVAVVAVDLAVRSRSPSRDPPLAQGDRGSRSQGRDGLDPRGHQFHDASCRRRSMSTPSMSTPSTRRLHLNHCLIHCRYPPRSRRTRRRSLADGQDALGVAQVILVKSRGRFTGRGGWAYALVQRVDGEEDEFEFFSPVRLFIVRD